MLSLPWPLVRLNELNLSPPPLSKKKLFPHIDTRFNMTVAKGQQIEIYFYNLSTAELLNTYIQEYIYLTLNPI